MKFSLTKKYPDAATEMLVVPLALHTKNKLPENLPKYITPAIIQKHIKGMDKSSIQKRNFSVLVKNKPCWVVLITTGKNKDMLALREWVLQLTSSVKSLQPSSVAINFSFIADQFNLGEKTLELFVRHINYDSYSFTHYKQKQPAKKNTHYYLKTNDTTQAAKKILTRAEAIANGQNLARDLGNYAPNECDVNFMHKQCKKIVSGHDNFSIQVVDKKQMEKLGFGAFLAVCNGSQQDPKLVIVQYKHPQAKNRPAVLLGKGLTFDSGGISLKPAPGMEEMKFDMCGAASVIGAMKAIAEIQPRLHAYFAVALAENMPGGSAARPGDIVTTLSGQSVEILNTDAEGRLVLCDALTYLQDTYKPETIIDVATLTGACVIALGHHNTALYSNNDSLITNLQKAAENSDDQLWHMPMGREYQKQLGSNIADLPNISGGRDAGSITAACYLSRFVSCKWAHLDIAGTAWVSGRNKLATGRPASLLSHYLLGIGK